MAVFVIGAGATRGCSFVDPTSDPCLPPLDKDFFTQLQRVQSKKHQDLVSNVVRDSVRLFGPNFDVTMETVFTTIEHTIRMVQITHETRAYNLEDLRNIRNHLVQAVAAVLEESLTEKRDHDGKGTLKLKHCEYQQKLVSDILRPRDTIITFNYDCVVDSHLRDYGDHKWNSRYGYGINLGARGKRLYGDEYWQSDNPAPREETIKLLKLHGSLHFDVTGVDKSQYKVKLKQRPYTNQRRGEMRFTIIPPEWHKRFDTGFFSDLWNTAADALYRDEHIVFIGYSLPITDMHATALFRTSVKSEKLRSIVVVNPDREARKRIRSVVQAGFSRDTRVLSFDTLREFAAANPSLWRI